MPFKANSKRLQLNTFLFCKIMINKSTIQLNVVYIDTK